MRKKAIGFLLCSVCAVAVFALLTAPQTRVQHQGSTAFQSALNQAVERLESGGKAILAGTATPVAAQPTPTFDGRYTCDTYDIQFNTCDPAVPGCENAGLPHTQDPLGHTCVAGEYTCELATCDTYDPQHFTCDANNAQCAPGAHTTEPPPYNHTCEGYTCDGQHTCDFTADPRALTCDAANVDCQDVTFNHTEPTCDPLKPECRGNNPKGACTTQSYPTCDGVTLTCDGSPGCTNPTKRTSWGELKHDYE